MQYLEANTSIAAALPPHERKTISVFELAFAFARMAASAAASAWIDPPAATRGNPDAPLKPRKSIVQHAVLSEGNPDPPKMQSGEARDWVRHRLRGRDVHDAADMVKQSLENLISHAVVQGSKEDAKKPGPMERYPGEAGQET